MIHLKLHALAPGSNPDAARVRNLNHPQGSKFNPPGSAI
jgi:hypothetical protein